MIEDHPFAIRVERDTSRAGYFRWTLLKGKHPYNRSEMSFTTKREAASEGAKVLDMRIAAWRTPRV